MNRIVLTVCCLALSTALAGCSSDKSEAPSSKSTIAPAPSETPESEPVPVLAAEWDGAGICLPLGKAESYTYRGPFVLTAENSDITISMISPNVMMNGLSLIGAKAAPKPKVTIGGAAEGWPLDPKELQKGPNGSTFEDLVGMTIPEGKSVVVDLGIKSPTDVATLDGVTINYYDDMGNTGDISAQVDLRFAKKC